MWTRGQMCKHLTRSIYNFPFICRLRLQLFAYCRFPHQKAKKAMTECWSTEAGWHLLSSRADKARMPSESLSICSRAPRRLIQQFCHIFASWPMLR